MFTNYELMLSAASVLYLSSTENYYNLFIWEDVVVVGYRDASRPKMCLQIQTTFLMHDACVYKFNRIESATKCLKSTPKMLRRRSVELYTGSCHLSVLSRQGRISIYPSSRSNLEILNRASSIFYLGIKISFFQQVKFKKFP
jgi:hypothetical protein